MVVCPADINKFGGRVFSMGGDKCTALVNALTTVPPVALTLDGASERLIKSSTFVGAMYTNNKTAVFINHTVTTTSITGTST